MDQSPIRTVEFGADGLPTDRRLRMIAMRLRALCDNRRGWVGDDFFLQRHCKPEELPLAVNLLAELRRHGTIIQQNGKWLFASPGRNSADTKDARQENYQAFAEGVADRLSSNGGDRNRALELFFSLRRIYGLHRVQTEMGVAMAVPTAVHILPTGAMPAEAVVVSINASGVALLKASGDAIGSAADGTLLTVSTENCPPWPESIQSVVVSPFTDHPIFGIVVGKFATEVFKSLAGQKEAVEVYLGHQISKKQWTGFLTSLRRAKRLDRYVRRTMWALLDPEIRRAAVRQPEGTYGLYNWLCGGGDAELRKRRLQASAAFPIFTSQLMQIENGIDQGQALMPALAKLLKLPVPVLRRLRGVTWQKIGGTYREVVSLDSTIMRLLAAVEPDKVPKNFQEWSHFSQVASWFRTLGIDELPSSLVTRSVARNSSFLRLMESGLPRAIQDVREVISMCTGRTWSENARMVSTDAVLTFIAGTSPTLSTLEDFNAAWHRNINGLLVAKRRMRRQANNGKIRRWRRLAETFTGSNGTLEWIVDEDTLEVEGIEMVHCVGSYVPNCVRGTSHIASIRSIEGRSTVEFYKEPRKPLVLIQHRNRFNEEPTAACRSVVEEFMLHARKPGVVRTPPKRKIKYQRDPDDVPLSDVDAQALLDLYEAVVPGISKTLGSWVLQEERAQPAIGYGML